MFQGSWLQDRAPGLGTAGEEWADGGGSPKYRIPSTPSSLSTQSTPNTPNTPNTPRIPHTPSTPNTPRNTNTLEYYEFQLAIT